LAALSARPERHSTADLPSYHDQETMTTQFDHPSSSEFTLTLEIFHYYLSHHH